MTLTFTSLVSWGARSETVPGFNTGGVHDRTTSVSFLTTRGACMFCASCASIDAFTVGVGVGAALGVCSTLGSADTTGVGAVTTSGAGELEAEGSGASGSGSGDWAGFGSTTSRGEFVLAGTAAGVGVSTTVLLASCCTLVFCCTPDSCCVFALTLTNEIVIPNRGIAIAVPTAPRIIFGCFARASELMRPLTQEIASWLQALTHSLQYTSP